MDTGDEAKSKMCWKLSLTHLLINKEISKEEYKKYYTLNFDNVDESSMDITIKVIAAIEDPDIFSTIVKNQTNFLLDGIIHDNFEYYWVFYLMECLDSAVIDDEEYYYYLDALDFGNPLNEMDNYLINEILEKLRVESVKKTPDLINSITNPSFEVLMRANNL